MPDPGVVTLAQVRSLAALRADLPTPTSSTFVTTSDWNNFIGLAYQELYGLLVQKFGNDYYVKDPPYSFTTDGVNDHFVLPTDFFKLLGVDLQILGMPNTYATLMPFTFAERNRYAFPYPAPVAIGSIPLRYRLNGGKIWLAPLPQSGLTVRVHYVPRLVLPTLDADTLDMVNGWEQVIIVDAARMALLKEESMENAAMLAQEKAQLLERLESEAENRDAGGQAGTTDTRGSFGFGPLRSGPFGTDGGGGWW